jgi:hypothetical protein
MRMKALFRKKYRSLIQDIPEAFNHHENIPLLLQP